jgi:hypothetical protein
VPEEWPRVGNGIEADTLPRSHRCEWKNGLDDSVYIITLFLCRLISDDCYEDYMTIDVYYCGGCVPLFVTIRY